MYFITGNKNKFEEIRLVLPDIEMLKLDLPELQSMDVHEIVRAKLAVAKEHGTFPCIVEDTAYSCDGLNGLPGPFIKFFLQALTREKFFNLVNSTGNTRSTGKTVIGYSDGTHDAFFEGEISGEIVYPRGESGFGYDPLFIPDGDTRTYAEMTRQEKRPFSSRGRAAEKLKSYLSEK